MASRLSWRPVALPHHSPLAHTHLLVRGLIFSYCQEKANKQNKTKTNTIREVAEDGPPGTGPSLQGSDGHSHHWTGPKSSHGQGWKWAVLFSLQCLFSNHSILWKLLNWFTEKRNKKPPHVLVHAFVYKVFSDKKNCLHVKQNHAAAA